MPRPSWDDEDKNQYPTVEGRNSQLTGQERAFMNQIRNREPLTREDQDELRRLWFKVDGANP